MPRMIEVKSGLTLIITGPARAIVYGAPALTGTNVEPQEATYGQSAPPAAPAAKAPAAT